MKIHIKTEKLYDFLTFLIFTSFYLLGLVPIGNFIMLGEVLVFLLLFTIDRRKIKILNNGLSHYLIFVLSLASYCYISSIWALNASISIVRGTTLIEIAICMAVIYIYYGEEKEVDRLLKCVMYSGYFVTFYYIFTSGYNNIIKSLLSFSRVAATFAETNSVSRVIVISVVISVYFWQKDGFRILYLIDILSVISISALGSRTSLVILVVGSLLCVVLYSLNDKKKISPIIRTFFIFILMIIFINFLSKLSLFSGINQRMDGLMALVSGSGKIDSSAQLRQQYMHIGMEQFLNNPILGIGIGNSLVVLKQTVGHYTYFHMNYIELLACGGIVGIILYYSRYIKILCVSIRYRKNLPQEWVVIITLFFLCLIADVGAVTYYSKETYFYFMIFYIFMDKAKGNKRYFDGKKENSIGIL